MYCTHCGSSNPEGAQFCASCGRPLTETAPGPANRTEASAGSTAPRTQRPALELRRPGLITLLACLQFFGAAILLITAVTCIALGLVPSSSLGVPGIAAGIFAGTLGVLELACGLGLWKLKPYGRTIQLVFSWIGLIGFPIGTIVSILILLYLKKPGVQILFSGRQAGDLTPEELVQVEALNQGKLVYYLAAAVAVLAVIAIGGIVAAIAVPGLLRSRMSANEAVAIGALRTINFGEAAYAAACADGGYAQSLEDLSKPSRESSEGFVSSDLAPNGGVRSGYYITLRADAGATEVTPAARTCNAAASGAMSSYFAEAHPVAVGSTGQRSFATDARGVIYGQTTGGILAPGMAGASPIQ